MDGDGGHGRIWMEKDACMDDWLAGWLGRSVGRQAGRQAGRCVQLFMCLCECMPVRMQAWV